MKKWIAIILLRSLYGRHRTKTLARLVHVRKSNMHSLTKHRFGLNKSFMSSGNNLPWIYGQTLGHGRANLRSSGTVECGKLTCLWCPFMAVPEIQGRGVDR